MVRSGPWYGLQSAALRHRQQTVFRQQATVTKRILALRHRQQTGSAAAGLRQQTVFWSCATVNKRFFGSGPPSTNGSLPCATVNKRFFGSGPPSTNGFIGSGPPSTNGFFGLAPPSTNGFIGSGPPSTNGFWSCATVNKRPNRQRGPSSSHAVVRLGLCAHSSDATAVCRPVATCGRMPICT